LNSSKNVVLGPELPTI